MSKPLKLSLAIVLAALLLLLVLEYTDFHAKYTAPQATEAQDG